MLTTSALRDYVYVVCISVDFNFCTVILYCHSIGNSYKEIVLLTQKANYCSLELVLFEIQILCNPM